MYYIYFQYYIPHQHIHVYSLQVKIEGQQPL